MNLQQGKRSIQAVWVFSLNASAGIQMPWWQWNRRLYQRGPVLSHSFKPSTSTLLPAGSAAELTQTKILKGGKYSWKSRHLLQVILQLLQHGFQLRHFLFEVPRRVTATETQSVTHSHWISPLFQLENTQTHQTDPKKRCLPFSYWIIFYVLAFFRLNKMRIDSWRTFTQRRKQWIRHAGHPHVAIAST